VKTGGRSEGRRSGRAERRTAGQTVSGVTRTTRGGKLAVARKKKSSGRNRPPRAPIRPSELLSDLKQLYPDAKCALVHRNAFELLCATILSAQCTDARVNMVTPVLFARYPTPFELAQANPAEVEEIIKSTGFFRNKTKSLIGMAQALVADYGGEVPRTMEELRKLPGVGRKTANVVLGNAFDLNEGVTVDTHVGRLSRLLGLSAEEDPVKVEQELMRLFPQEEWALLSHLLIFHGRQVCIARRPKCSDCVLSRVCPSSLV
jgi:endonuclease III